MNWRQPTPTDINDKFDFLTRALFREILAYCKNEDGIETFWHGNKFFTVKLKRGQMILKVQAIAESIGINRSRIEKRLKTITENYTELSLEGKPFGCIVTVKMYDQLVSMQTKTEPKTEPKRNRSVTEPEPSNKSVKSERVIETTQDSNFFSYENVKERQRLLDEKLRSTLNGQ